MGKFLQTIVTDKEKTISAQQIAAYGHACKLGRKTVQKSLEEFRRLGIIDSNVEMTEYRILSRDGIRVLDAVYQILSYEGMATDLEMLAIHFMEFLNIRPREIKEISRYCLSLNLGSEVDLKILIRIFTTYNLITLIEDGEGGQVYFSLFQNKSVDFDKDINVLLRLVNPIVQEQIDGLVGKIYRIAGLLKENCGVPDEIIQLAANLGLIEVVTVNSAGSGLISADFVMPPSVKIKGMNMDTLEDDIFHNAKLLLSSIRFGEQRSIASRGRIMDPVILMSRLIEDNEVGPCTAIGEDYVVLETEGVIETNKAEHKTGEQYYMSLRRREPAVIVKRLLESGFRETHKNTGATQDIAFPTSFNPPEIFKVVSSSQLNKSTTEARQQLILELRTARHDR
ncbi:hypothetical protein DEFR109230_03605 [Deinococcus frigens]